VKLKDKVAIITGAGRNIGEETAKLFASEGAKLVIVDMDKARGEKVAGDIKKAGGQAISCVANIASESEVDAVVKAAVGAFGRVDVLINNAAISDNKTILDISKEEWDRVLAVTLSGPFLRTRAVAKQMVAQGQGGAIVNVGSTSGERGRVRAIAYVAAKGGLHNMTRSMAVQLAPHKIRVNGVIPNKIGSPVGKEEFDPTRPVVNLAGRPGVPMDLARALLFLASDDASFVVGELMVVDGGALVTMEGS
jgi:NAD(P)-dependent dehydrogenase (short-subunit alcohol dehydrogenase family)